MAQNLDFFAQKITWRKLRSSCIRDRSNSTYAPKGGEGVGGSLMKCVRFRYIRGEGGGQKSPKMCVRTK